MWVGVGRRGQYIKRLQGSVLGKCGWKLVGEGNILKDYKVVSAANRLTEFSCQTGQVRFMIYLPRLKFSCPQKCICLAMSKC